MSSFLAFSIWSNSPSLISLTAIEISFNKSKSSLSMESKSPLDNKKSPTKTAILFFQSALIEKKPLLLLLSSTISS